jgi:hypothetical protein
LAWVQQRRGGAGSVGGGEGRVGGKGRLAWARCRFEFYLLLTWVSCPLSVFSLYSFFLPFLSCACSLYSDFRVYLSDFA